MTAPSRGSLWYPHLGHVWDNILSTMDSNTRCCMHLWCRFISTAMCSIRTGFSLLFVICIFSLSLTYPLYVCCFQESVDCVPHQPFFPFPLLHLPKFPKMVFSAKITTHPEYTRLIEINFENNLFISSAFGQNVLRLKFSRWVELMWF
jgi:hypothetical protein